MALALVASSAASVRAQQQASPPAEENIGPDLITVPRVRELPPAERQPWIAYINRSRQLHRDDIASFEKERRQVRAEPGFSDLRSRPPYSAPDFPYGDRSDAWLATDSARQIANAVLSFQTPSGGWSKRTDMTSLRWKGMAYYSETETWHYIPTFDNGATTGQLRFLGRMPGENPIYAKAFERGLDLILAAQMPNGCWPQTFPLEGGYHDAATYNDNTIVLILRLLGDVASGRLGMVRDTDRKRAATSVAAGLDCILASQVVVKGKRTVWAQQHDPLTLAPVRARTYELAGLAGRESAVVMMYLMSLDAPNARVVASVHDAAAWFRTHETHGVRYDASRGVHPDTASGPVWARITEIGTNKPVFANRDGVKLYDWNLLTDRKVGYAWFNEDPAAALRAYDAWAAAHPQRTGR